MSPSPYDLTPTLQLMLVGALIAVGPVLWVLVRRRHATPAARLHALTLITLFLTFDLVLFGAFTRLTDSGLGCPDWPGCYGNASPIGASSAIAAAQSAMPTGPVTHSKAWVEMVHRYWATGVGAMIFVIVVFSWLLPLSGSKNIALPSPWYATATLVWVCVQGAFGALTVTMKLFPAIVSLHLLGGYLLLVLLVVLVVQLKRVQGPQSRPAVLPGVKVWMAVALAMLFLQAASGAWVSTNYAVLACSEFPQCQGQWWPPMDFRHGFEIWRELGLNQDGSHISFQALTAIHFVHRGLAVLTVLVVGTLAAYLWGFSPLIAPSRTLIALLTLQLVTGISNVVLGWPLAAAVVHTGGAGAMVAVLTWLLATTQAQTRAQRALAFSRRMSE